MTAAGLTMSLGRWKPRRLVGIAVVLAGGVLLIAQLLEFAGQV
jgi:hypothetical protein